VSPFTGLPLVHYECGCGQADVDLSVVAEGRGQRLVWGGGHMITGDMRAVMAGWEAAADQDLGGLPVVSVEPEPAAAVAARPPEWYLGSVERERLAREQAEYDAREPVFK